MVNHFWGGGRKLAKKTAETCSGSFQELDTFEWKKKILPTRLLPHQRPSSKGRFLEASRIMMEGIKLSPRKVNATTEKCQGQSVL